MFGFACTFDAIVLSDKIPMAENLLNSIQDLVTSSAATQKVEAVCGVHVSGGVDRTHCLVAGSAGRLTSAVAAVACLPAPVPLVVPALGGL